MEFREEQKFNQWWLWLTILGIGIFPVYGIYKQFIIEEQFGNNPMSNNDLLVYALFSLGLIVLFISIKLTTEINRDGINMQFFPFVKKRIDWDEIESTKIIDYGFVWGWGIRLWTRYGTVYNVNGKKGLAIVLRSGKKYLIGTQKEEELALFLEKLKP